MRRVRNAGAVQPYTANAALLGAGAVPSADGPASAKYSAFNLKSYRKFFNVDTQARRQQSFRLLQA